MSWGREINGWGSSGRRIGRAGFGGVGVENFGVGEVGIGELGSGVESEGLEGSSTPHDPNSPDNLS